MKAELYFGSWSGFSLRLATGFVSSPHHATVCCIVLSGLLCITQHWVVSALAKLGLAASRGGVFPTSNATRFLNMSGRFSPHHATGFSLHEGAAPFGGFSLCSTRGNVS